MEPEEEQQRREEVDEAGVPESEDAEPERGGWTETEDSPHEGEEGQEIV